MGLYLYGDVDPDRFGSLGESMFTMFALITLDDWGFMYSDNREKSPSIWFYLWSYIIIVNFVFMKQVGIFGRAVIVY